jgi:hypothetical protein
LEKVDADYDMSVRLKVQQREKQVELGKRKIEQAEARLIGYRNQISRIQEKQAVELVQVAVSKDLFRSAIESGSGSVHSVSAADKKCSVPDKNSQLRGELEKREGVLRLLRSENEGLKRTIAALRDEERFAERSVVLGLQ